MAKVREPGPDHLSRAERGAFLYLGSGKHCRSDELQAAVKLAQ